MGEKVKSPLLQKAFDEGKKVYSYSKINTFNGCQLEFFKTYIAKEKSRDNVYSYFGDKLHLGIEKIYRGESTVEEMQRQFTDYLVEGEMLGYKFPNEVIKNSWEKDIQHFIDNFTPIEKKFVLERHFVLELENDIVLQGYIDAMVQSEKGKGYVDIIDWKSRSKFRGKKLKEAGRQLLMYKLAIESTSNLKVDKLMWFMMKYLNVCWKLKNGKTKKKMCNRGKWVKEMKNPFTKDLQALGYDDFEIEMLLDEAIANNSIDTLPDEIKDKYTLEDCFVEYEVTNQDIEEFKTYVIETIEKIEGKSKVEEEWKPLEITKYESFYCSNLCGHKSTCGAYQTFIAENAEGFVKKENNTSEKDEFEDLF